MAFVLADRVLETSTTTGNGTFTLAGATTGYQSFSAIGNGNTTYYTIAHQSASEWEVGIGTYTSAGTTLSRDTVLASSSGGAKVVFSAGTKNVFCDYPAGKAVYEDVNENVTVPAGTISAGNGIFLNATTINNSTTIGTGYNGLSVGPITIAAGATVTVASGQKWIVADQVSGLGIPVGTAYGGTGQISYTDGQLLIGNSTGNTLTKATLTAGTNISITNGAGSITVATTNNVATTGKAIAMALVFGG